MCAVKEEMLEKCDHLVAVWSPVKADVFATLRIVPLCLQSSTMYSYQDGRLGVFLISTFQSFKNALMYTTDHFINISIGVIPS